MAKIYDFKPKRAGAVSQKKVASVKKAPSPFLRRAMEMIQFILFMGVLFWFVRSCQMM